MIRLIENRFVSVVRLWLGWLAAGSVESIKVVVPVADRLLVVLFRDFLLSAFYVYINATNTQGMNLCL